MILGGGSSNSQEEPRLPSNFTYAEAEQMRALRAGYSNRSRNDLFSEVELARLAFVRWMAERDPLNRTDLTPDPSAEDK